MLFSNHVNNVQQHQTVISVTDNCNRITTWKKGKWQQ